MGWASMNEDNESRYFNASIIRNQVDKQMNASPSPAPAPTPTRPGGSRLSAFAAPQPRPFPVIILADVSGSMDENGKIEALNTAIRQMLASFARESQLRARIQVGLITFGGKQAQLHLPLVDAQAVQNVKAFTAAGTTPMGGAFELARELLEDPERIPARAYRPVLVLVSDGVPTDDWEKSLAALQASERACKASRIAMAIGADADTDVLQRFANHPEAPVFKAHEARDIQRFFQAVTMSVVARSSSPTPDTALILDLNEVPDDDLDLDAI
ncbi:VWA domain-containing protein [Pseudacidovorax sp. RU35E]|uniref:vWA domain-containing protein n=1 Tax=Pseudacidovorax sp. RU35E TaxID=1907403 RepID=UPI0009550098|nr:VWA domain-containing protein [Pseudacidovorax sp. RU35E]SIR51366.1 Uncharacterized conserved protein YegL, contains vWA domain of TerY type [Pseudacidovorax sp. RU35E]